MAKKQLDQIFADRLGKHEMRPSPKAWERIAKNSGIAEPKKRKYRGGLWLLLLSFAAMGGLYWAHRSFSEAPGIVSQAQSSPEAITEEKSPATEPLTTASPTALPPTATASPSNLTLAPKQAVARPRVVFVKEKMPAHLSEQAKLDEAALPPSVLERANAQNAVPFPHPLRAKPKAQQYRYHYRVEITIPYEPKSERTNEPRSMIRRVMKNVLAD